MLNIRLTSGLVGKKDTQRRVISALGLRKFGTSVVHADSPTIQGMLRKVHHLVTVTDADGNDKSTKTVVRPTAAEKKTKAASVSTSKKQKAESK